MNPNEEKAERLASKEIVLLGVGHTNAHIVRKWGMSPLEDTRLTCVSNFAVATYSGMMPAVLARQASVDEMQIDLVRLCASVGARLIVDRVTGLNLESSQLVFDDRPPVRFDVLSIGVGSVPDDRSVAMNDDSLLCIKPMQTFLERLRRCIEESIANKMDANEPMRIAVVGAGVAGAEVLLCLPRFLDEWPEQRFDLELVTRGEKMLNELSAATRDRVLRVLNQRGVSVRYRSEITRVEPGVITCESGEQVKADAVIWATGARAPDFLGKLGLPTDDRGFITTDRHLRVPCEADTDQSDRPIIFAVGDSGTPQVASTIPKAGVYAVRQGPILWENVKRALCGKPLKPFRPQRSFLRLINTGDGKAIGQWKGLSFAGGWVWKLKDKIDRDFMQKFEPVSMSGAAGEMQCDGCGCKLGANVLHDALDESWRGSLDPSSSEVSSSDGPVGAQGNSITLDDAVVLDGSQSKLFASTDFFTNPLNDAFEFGRLTALHAASDLTATGVEVRQAFATVVLPGGDAEAQKTLFAEFTAGARREFERLGAAICGGHTIVGPRFEAGFTVVGEKIGENPLVKAGLQPGDQLFLTKPLGIGVLLAAHMRSQCHAADYLKLMDALFEEQSHWIHSAIQVGCRAATDVTGFGLAGHLLEMLEASACNAELELERIPLLAGAVEAVQSGIESSLAPANKTVMERMRIEAGLNPAKLALLFDPQTCGGFLIAIPASRIAGWDRVLQSSGRSAIWRIGCVLESATDSEEQLLQVR